MLYTAALWIPSITRDMFIIIIACSLSEKFKHLNEKLANIRKEVSFDN